MNNVPKIIIHSIDDFECDGTIKEIDPITREGLEFSITPQDDNKFSIWVGVSVQINEETVDYVKGWHHDDQESMVAALAFVLEEYGETK